MNEKTCIDAIAQARHDLRNPMSHILGFAEMLLERAEQSPFRAALEEICRLANSLVSLINAHLKWPVGDLPLLQEQIRNGGETILALINCARTYPQAASLDEADDLARMAEAAKQVMRLSETALPGLQILLDTQPCSADFQSAVSRAASPQTVRTDFPQQVHAKAIFAPPQAKSSILVVDDLEEIRTLLQGKLDELGYQVHLAGSGPEALRFLENTPVDLILLDITMPGMDGIEVLRQLKAAQPTQPIPVLMLTFSESPEQLALCLKLGAEGSISKPFKHVLLQASLQKTLGKNKTD